MSASVKRSELRGVGEKEEEMASLFKRSGKGNWIAQYYNHDRTRRLERSTGTTDRRLADRLAQKWEAREIERREGLVDVRAEALATHQSKRLSSHLADYTEFLLSKGTSQQTVETAEARIATILKTARAEYASDLLPTPILAAIRQLRQPGTLMPKGLSNKTASHYVAAIKGFSRWLVRDKRTASDDLATLKGFNEETDRRRVRRNATPEELHRILAVASANPSVTVPRPYRSANGERRVGSVQMNYPDRVWAYRAAAGTGFRASEIASLTRESVDLECDPPTITVQAAYSKHKRMDVQPIRRDLADALRPYIASKRKGERLFMLPAKKAALLLRADMETARAAWIDEATDDLDRREREQSDFLRHTDSQGRIVDFHGLRHTFISNVVQSGASVKVAQELARHSTPTLTIGRYSHTRRADLAAALDVMPSLNPGLVGTADARHAESTPQHQPQQSLHETVLSGSVGCDRLRAGKRNAARRNSSSVRGLGEPVRSHATRGESAEGRTRTADLRVMNPAL